MHACTWIVRSLAYLLCQSCKSHGTQYNQEALTSACMQVLTFTSKPWGLCMAAHGSLLIPYTSGFMKKCDQVRSCSSPRSFQQPMHAMIQACSDMLIHRVHAPGSCVNVGLLGEIGVCLLRGEHCAGPQKGRVDFVQNPDLW